MEDIIWTVCVILKKKPLDFLDIKKDFTPVFIREKWATLRSEAFLTSFSAVLAAILLQGSSLMWAKETDSNLFSQESCLPRHGSEPSVTVTGHRTHLHPEKLITVHGNGTQKLKSPGKWLELDPNPTDLLFHDHLFSLSSPLVSIPLLSFFSAPLLYFSIISNDIPLHPVSRSPWCFATGSAATLYAPMFVLSFDCQHPGSCPVFLTTRLPSEFSFWQVLPTYVYFFTIILSCHRKPSYFGAVKWMRAAGIEIFSTHGDNENKVYCGQDAACFLYL